MKRYRKYILTGSFVFFAILLLVFQFWKYLNNPWTRDGKVQADIIQVTPRVSGQVVDLPIRNNQFINAGDLLFQIDPRTYQAALEEAKAQYEEALDNYRAQNKNVLAYEARIRESVATIDLAKSNINALSAEVVKTKAEYDRQRDLLPQRATSVRALQAAQAAYESTVEYRAGADASLVESMAVLEQSQAELEQAKAELGAPGADNPSVRAAFALVRQAELNLEYATVTAPVSGYVTNIDFRYGDQAVANQPALSVVDVSTFRIDGFFRETFVRRIAPGDRAIMTLMAYPDHPLEGYVESIGWGIAREDGTAGNDLLPKIDPTFDWIRLAQRIPVRIHLTNIPEKVKLRVGFTSSVLVISDSAGTGQDVSVHTQ
ncbi:HlyD family secretion protein [Microbulbifer sp. OS29]|uniref:HlyD family secretion protein n=1 Tax=Microbulbifer okhotskensis TaxID=2926617 RepID=A0A9X2EQL7_9GAMM|nr:HlyD family secretion protein [Microbulbifer okhotskensis]MCO1336592.1 HlyD family secretion protein [Microbulbifer okhotskensis]